jgi:uncharacterized protein YdhG (YjbR/CyaY superfamily)
MSENKQVKSGRPRLSAVERQAVKAATAEARKTASGKNGEQDVLDAIAAMTGSDRQIAEGLHALARRIAPELAPRTWYGFPAYAKEGKVVFFWQFAGKFKTRYGHLGFQDSAALDDGSMWPTAFAITEWTKATEDAVESLIRRSLGGSELR